MKSKFLVTFLACFLLSFSFAAAQQGEVTLDHVTGTMYNGQPDSIMAGSTYVFSIRFNNNSGLTVKGMTNGFTISSPDGATWTSASIDTVGTIGKAQFDLVFNSTLNAITGSEADTVGFGAATLFGSGMPNGFNDVVYDITVGPVSTQTGQTICLDSASYSAQGIWKWAPTGTDLFPSWDGPHCYTIVGDGPPPNSAPVLGAIGSKSVDENANLNFVVTATDPDGTTPTISAENLPTGATFNSNTFDWTPSFNDAGIYNVTFIATDGALSDTEIVAITVNDANRPPTWVSSFDPIDVDENQAVERPVGAIDLDGDTVIITHSTLPDGAIFGPNFLGVDAFQWTPTYDQAGVYEIIFTASDGDLSIVDTLVITVIDVNRAPVLDAIGAKSGDEGTLISFAVSASDPDGTTPTLSMENSPSGATFLGGVFDWTPTFLQSGDYDVTFIATDGSLSDSEVVTITVNNVNQPPVLDPIGPKVVTAGEELFFSVSASDLDGTFPDLNATPLPGTSEFVDSGNGNGYFRWVTEISDSGSYDVTFSATDGEFTDDEVVSITVGEAPKMIVVDTNLFNLSYIDGVSTGDTVLVNVSELNNAVISVNSNETASWFDLMGSNPFNTPQQIAIEIFPLSLSVGVYSDTLFLSSPDAVNNIAIVLNVEITEKPNTPAILVSALDTLYVIDECGQVDLAFYAFDADADPVAITVVGLVENMTFVDNGDSSANFNFTPNFSQEGFYQLEVVLFDGKDSSQYLFAIQVNNCEPGTEGDTLTVATVPAVPGARLTVPVDFANLCNLEGFDVSFGWNSPNITLDSISFVDSRAEVTVGFNINNDSQFVSLYDVLPEGQIQSPGSGNLVNLHFSLNVNTPAGFYPIDFFNEPVYDRNCGGGVESVRPYFIPGGIVVDTSGNYVCGYVVDPEGNPIADASVELWDNFPSGSVQAMQNASGTGVFSFADFNTIPFDLYAYHPGYYPGKVENINFAQSGIMIVLTPIPNQVTATNVWVDFFCGVNTFKDAPLPVGSVIEAYDPDGVKCGEFVVSTAGEYGFMHVYGDDEFSPEDEGAVPGDALRFFINGVEAITGATPIWTQDRDQFEVCLDLPDVVPHSCFLSEGWNLVSWNVDTDVDDIQTVLSSIDACVEVVLGFEQGALTYDASLPQFSDLWMVDHLSAYWVKVSCDVELTVVGTPVPSTTPIPVTAGWNLVSYLPDYSLATDVALSSIQNDLIVALGYETGNGLTYLPGQSEFNDLDIMSSCFGYWVKVSNDGTLIYPEDQPLVSPTIGKSSYVQTSSSAGRINGTTSWMNIYAYDLKVNNTQVKAGSEIKAFDSENQLVGSYIMKENGKFGFMPIYGDDKQTRAVDGMKSGEEFYLTIDGVETEERFTWTSSGDKMEISGLSAKTLNDALPVDFSLSQNYPNPFNPSTIISFAVPVTGNAKIEIFNMLGQLIATPYNDVAEAGQHDVTWDGRSSDGKSVASGIYFYRLTADNFTNTKKMTLLK